MNAFDTSLFGKQPISEGGGYVVPSGFAEAVIVLESAPMWVSAEFLEDMGYPPRSKGLAYWQRKEREAIAARHPINVMRTRIRRIRWFWQDVPRRLTNAVAALQGDWERSEDD